MHGNMVLPPLGPLFATHTNQSHSHGHHRQLVAVAASETLHVAAALRTPTSGHAHAYLHGGVFPSSSPVKKDMSSSNAAVSTKSKMGDHHSHHKKSHTGMSSSVLNLDSPKAVDKETSNNKDDDDEDADFGSASPTCEDEKLRLSRERNRLHAQRTRIRKRELLESLKERIHALQSEHLLLKQAYEFHATAVCLLSLGGGPECDHPSLKHLEDVSEAALELFDSTSTLNACLDDEDDLDDFHSSSFSGHEKGCEWYNEGDESDQQDQQQCSESSCSCQQDTGQLNSNGKRSHPSSQPSGSKEEREQLRRERNRLHARRARLRKKLILERSQQVCLC